jgi:hypothetical protein
MMAAASVPRRARPPLSWNMRPNRAKPFSAAAGGAASNQFNSIQFNSSALLVMAFQRKGSSVLPRFITGAPVLPRRGAFFGAALCGRGASWRQQPAARSLPLLLRAKTTTTSELLEQVVATHRMAAGKKQRKKKDPKAPKKPMSAYLFYCQEEREEVAASTGASFGETTRILASQWKALSVEDKAPYNERAAQAKVYYDEAMKAYTGGP